MRIVRQGPILLALLLPQAIMAQQAPSRSVADYVCIFSGRCGGNAVQGFSLGPRPSTNLQLSFQSGSARLTRQSAADASVFAKALMTPALANMRFRIEGHTDSAGSRAYNLRLSRERAEAVVAYLVKAGVKRGRLVAQGYGFERPMEGRPASDPRNRRVEAIVLR